MAVDYHTEVQAKRVCLGIDKIHVFGLYTDDVKTWTPWDSIEGGALAPGEGFPQLR